jgi:hypothetical protein
VGYVSFNAKAFSHWYGFFTTGTVREKIDRFFFA